MTGEVDDTIQLFPVALAIPAAPKERVIRIYHLDVVYPEGVGCDNPPKAWCDFMDLLAEGGRPDWEPEFHWPSRRNFFTLASAERRAGFLREYGCTVTVRRSKPVEFEEVS